MMAQVVHRPHRDHRAAPRLLGPLDARAVAHRARAVARAARRRSPAIKHALSPYCYRCPLGLTYPTCGVRVRAGHRGADPHHHHRPDRRRSSPSRSRAWAASSRRRKEYFQIAVEIVRKYGGVFICDEVQTGFGRTGGKWWGIEQYGVEPEIMTMAKGIANGLPLSAHASARPTIADSLKKLTISTFGGNPVSCAAANATIDVHRERRPAPRTPRAQGARLRAGLERAAGEAPAHDRRRARHGPDAGRRAGRRTRRRRDRTPNAEGDAPALRGDQEARAADRQGRPLRQRAAHLAAAHRERGRGGRGARDPRRVAAPRWGRQ